MKTPEQIFDETHQLFYKALHYGETNHKELAVIMMGEYGRLVQEEQIKLCSNNDVTDNIKRVIK